MKPEAKSLQGSRKMSLPSLCATAVAVCGALSVVLAVSFTFSGIPVEFAEVLIATGLASTAVTGIAWFVYTVCFVVSRLASRVTPFAPNWWVMLLPPAAFAVVWAILSAPM